MELEAGKTYVFVDEEAKETWLCGNAQNKEITAGYDGGFLISEVCCYGEGWVGEDCAISASEKVLFKLKSDNKPLLDKEGIISAWIEQDKKNKTEIARSFNTSARTVGRIIAEHDKKSPVVEESLPLDYVVTRNAITITVGEESRTVDRTFHKFAKLKKGLIGSEFSDEVLVSSFEAMCLKRVIETFSEGNLVVNHTDSTIYYGSFEVKNSLVGHIFKLLEDGDDVLPMVRFLDKLLANPKEDIVEELYGFMKHNNIGIANDGDILAFKGVRNNYRDGWTNTIDNSVGCSPKMPRHLVEYDPKNGCGAGLHAGSLEYATNWYDLTMEVKINPANVVSVPYDCDAQKMRTCGYDVIGEV